MNRLISDSAAGLGEPDALAPPRFDTVRGRGTKATTDPSEQRTTGVAA
jgi:hypothetical protein